MARVTRSQKLDIAEDTFARAIQLPLPDTPLQPQRGLTEMFLGPNSMTMVDDGTAAEVKNLKAAYRAALGIGKKSRKTRNKKAEQQDSTTVDGSAVTEQSHQTQATSPEAPSHAFGGTGVEAPAEQISKPRATRQQAAKQQHEGQFGNEVSVKTQDQLAAQRRTDLSYITSLFGGRSTGPYRSFIRPGDFGRSITNDEIALAQEKRAKALQENIKDVRSHSTEPELTKAPPQYTPKIVIVAANKSAESPSKTRTMEEIEVACAVQLPNSPAANKNVDEEDSFCEQIISRSPAKLVTRIEDSVEALDQLEEALEALDQAALGKSPASKKAPQTNAMSDKSKAQSESRSERRQNATKQQASKPGYATVRVRPTVPKQSPVLKKAVSMTFNRAGTDSPAADQGVVRPDKPVASKRPLSLLPPKESAKPAKPVTRPAPYTLPGEAISHKLKQQREARRAQRESSEDSQKDTFHGPKAKSTKSMTKPTFQLPGEALSQKKREALEARLKVQEEAERKRREFKARPVKMSTLPNTIPRDTVASRARQNKIVTENSHDRKTDSTKAAGNIGTHRMSMTQLNMANVSAPRAPGPPSQQVRRVSPATVAASAVPGHSPRTLSAHDVQIQRQRAKEIYNRDVFLTEDIERERKEREAAAKRARAEAAERGRQASREWAEKQRQKRLAEGNKGLMAGYGPGGQLGLHA